MKEIAHPEIEGPIITRGGEEITQSISEIKRKKKKYILRNHKKNPI